jgi:hypothetical protein
MVSLREKEEIKHARELELGQHQDSDPRLLEEKRSISHVPAYGLSSSLDQALQGGDNAYRR